MSKANRLFENKKLILMMVILSQCIFISILFALKKEGYHSDEIWNYGFANSTDGEHIYTENGKDKNCYAWIDSNTLLEYISVDKSEIFSYNEVYRNCAKDINPPLQNMILHLICSFFQNVWSKWFCFFINLISFTITQIFLYKIIRIISDDENFSLIGVLFFGFCAGVVYINIFLRIYAMGVMFATMYMYYSTKIFKEDSKKDYIKLFLVGFFGAMTIHMFLVIAFAITLVYSAYYLLKKNYKKMMVYGMIALFFVFCSVLAFPSTIPHLTAKNAAYNSGKLSLGYQIVKYFEYISSDTIGIHNFADPTLAESIAGLIIAGIIFVIIALLYFNRKKDIVIQIKETIFGYLKRIIITLKKTGYPLIVLVFGFLIYLIITSKMSAVGTMGKYARRYVFLSYPLFVCIVLFFVKTIFESTKIKVKNINMIITLIMLILAALSHVFSDKAFYFSEKREGISFDDIEKNADCIVVLDSKWLFTCATIELYDTDKFYFTDRANYIQDNYELVEDNDKPVYLLLDVSNEYKGDEFDEDAKSVARINGSLTNKQEILNYYENLGISSECKLEGCDYFFGRKIEIYKLHP